MKKRGWNPAGCKASFWLLAIRLPGLRTYFGALTLPGRTSGLSARPTFGQAAPADRASPPPDYRDTATPRLSPPRPEGASQAPLTAEIPPGCLKGTAGGCPQTKAPGGSARRFCLRAPPCPRRRPLPNQVPLRLRGRLPQPQFSPLVPVPTAGRR